MKNDLFELIYDACDHKLSKHQPLWDDDFALTVVMAAKNYPNSPEKGIEIINANYKSPTQYVFHAGTKKENEKILTNGGRVLGLTGKGKNLQLAFNEA